MAVNINLSGILPPLPANAATPTTNVATASILSGTILGKDASGNALLQTTSGQQISFSSDFVPPVGSLVSVELKTIGTNNPTGQILSVNGQNNQNVQNTPPPVEQTNPSQIILPAVLSAAATTTSQNNTITSEAQNLTVPGTTVTGVLISQQAAVQPFINQAAPGTQLTLRVVPETQVIVPVSAATNVSNVAVVSLENTRSNSGYGGQAFNSEGEKKQEGENSPTHQEQSSSPLSGQVFTARIIGNTTAGETLIKTPLGLIRLDSLSALESGKTVTFEIVSTNNPLLVANAANTIINTAPTPITTLAQQWTALQQIFNLLSGQATGAKLSNQLSYEPLDENTDTGLDHPATTITAQSFSAGLFGFIFALKQNDFKKWLGKDNVKWLHEHGHDALVGKAEEDFHTLARQFNHAGVSHWRSLFFPVAIDGQVQQARIFVKQDDSRTKDQAETSDKHTRFVVELNLSKLGEIQMDGFVRQSAGLVQFDMMIRSLMPLPQAVQKDILSIYNSVAEITGYKGSVSFQNVREFPINPMQEIVGKQSTFTA